MPKPGFVHCGTIYVEEDDAPRLAYEKSEKLVKTGTDVPTDAINAIGASMS